MLLLFFLLGALWGQHIWASSGPSLDGSKVLKYTSDTTGTAQYGIGTFIWEQCAHGHRAQIYFPIQNVSRS